MSAGRAEECCWVEEVKKGEVNRREHVNDTHKLSSCRYGQAITAPSPLEMHEVMAPQLLS